MGHYIIRSLGGLSVLLFLASFILYLFARNSKNLYLDPNIRRVNKKHSAENIIFRNVPQSIREIEHRHPLQVLVSSESHDSYLRTWGAYYFDSRHHDVKDSDLRTLTEAVNEELRSPRIVINEGSSERLVLHEYGHFVDYCVETDLLSDSKEWESITKISRSYTTIFVFGFNRISIHFGSHYRTPLEFFAECFAQYYQSTLSRKRLEGLFPEAFNYFKDLEGRLSQASL